jgi:hypothetical protein
MGSFSLLFSGLRKETIKPTGFLLSWIRHLVFMFVLTWLIVLGLQAFLPEPLLEEKLDDAVTYFLIALIIFTIGYRSLSQPEIFAERAGKDNYLDNHVFLRGNRGHQRRNFKKKY